MSLRTVGSKAPGFETTDQNGAPQSLSQYKGSWVVLYFYPKDMTPGCTTEACSFRDRNDELTALGAVVLGVSADSEARHKTFTEKHNLTFPLLVDTEKAIIKAYGVWGPKKFMGREFDGIRRTTFLIDPNGVIRRVFDQVKPKTHVEELILALNELKSKE